MDHSIVYQKTAAGEETMRHRTRLMQRNTRMVLILVDGVSSCADLCQKTGNPQLTENALLELEKGGFIQPRVDSKTILGEGRRIAKGIGSAARVKAANLVTGKRRNEHGPSFKPGGHEGRTASISPQATASPQFDAMAQASPSASSFVPLPPKPDEAPREVGPGRGAGGAIVLPAPLVVGGGGVSAFDPASLVHGKPPEYLEESGASAAAGVSKLDNDPIAHELTSGAGDEGGAAPGGWFDRLWRKGQRDALSDRRDWRARSGWQRLVLLFVGGMVALPLLFLFFFPLSNYRAVVEEFATQACGKSVQIGDMQIVFYPHLGLRLNDVRVMQGAEELRVAEIRVRPEFGAVFAERKLIREIVLVGAELRPEVVLALPSVFSSLARPASRLVVQRAALEKASLEFSGLKFGSLEGELVFDSSVRFNSLVLRSADRALSFELGVGNGLAVLVEAYGWRPLPGKALQIDSLSLKGVVNAGLFDISSFDLRAFDGALRGTGQLSAEKRPHLRGKLDFERLNALKIGELIGFGSVLQGEVGGNVSFSMQADVWGDVFSEPNAEGQVNVRRGSVRGIDLAEAARRVSSAPVQGGATQFEQITARIRVHPLGCQLSEILLSSGLMQSRGGLDIGDGGALKGRLELQIQGSANQTRIPVSIGGTLKAPIVNATR